MGFDVTICDGDLKVIEGPFIGADEPLQRWLWNESEGSPLRCLPFIDAYDGTFFNSLQVPLLMEEWSVLTAEVDLERRWLDGVADMASRITTHRFLCFGGD